MPRPSHRSAARRRGSGTNPICFAIPSNLEGPLFFDMATSAAAAGKINVATARGEQVPAGWLIDADGNPSTDPRVLRQGGALLPVGGAEGYKGYGLATMWRCCPAC